MTTDVDVATLSYEQALDELDTLIRQLERGDVALEDAIRCYERGSRLAQHCAELLDRTEAAVTQLVVGGGGQVQERPLTAADAGQPAPETPGRQRPSAPPPPGAPLRARPLRETTSAAGTPTPGLFPGLEPASPSAPAAPGEADFDLDDIPF